MDYASSGGLYWATGTYSLTYVFKPRLCGRKNGERDHAFILPVLAGPRVRLVKKRLCCKNRVKRVLPLTPLGFGLRA